MAACILAITFASTFSVIFPLIGPAVVLLVFLTLVGTSSNNTFSFRSESDSKFSPPLPHWLCVRPHALADRRFAADLAAKTLRLARCNSAHPSGPDFLQSTTLAGGHRARQRRRHHHRLC